MPPPEVERPDLPEYLAWEDLERLPEELAAHIELWEGRVVRARREPFEHQQYTGTFWSALRRNARDDMARRTVHRWQVGMETNIFLKPQGKSDFVTPHFVILRCLESEYQDVRATDVLLAGKCRGRYRCRRTDRIPTAAQGLATQPSHHVVALQTSQLLRR
ncbi:hypothetical protein [Nocardia carnea]|nr:hypothetical protein [Nocardia carnea]